MYFQEATFFSCIFVLMCCSWMMSEPLPSTFKDMSKVYPIRVKLYKIALFLPFFPHQQNRILQLEGTTMII